MASPAATTTTLLARILLASSTPAAVLVPRGRSVVQSVRGGVPVVSGACVPCGRWWWSSSSGAAAGGGGGIEERVEDSSSIEVPAGAGGEGAVAVLPVATRLCVSGREDCSIVPCFRVLTPSGADLADATEGEQLLTEHGLLPERSLSVRLQTAMLRVQTMDMIFYQSQRQGNQGISFYMVSDGEEGVSVGSAAALHDEDVIFTQYREQGALLWRGFSFDDFADQCYGNSRDLGKGRQMPVHYGDRSRNFVTVSSPLATQIPQAVGAAYGMKLAGEKRCAVVFFGEGAASEGDCHAAMNFAATLQAPVIFVCRNNGWAISTPANEQYGGFGIAERGPAYGLDTIRVDGNDVLAVHIAMRKAREIAVEEVKPVFIETMSYRGSHHSTSDDSSRYRDSDEVQKWRSRDPISRHRRWMIAQGWWTDAMEQEVQEQARQEAIDALDRAAQAMKPPLSAMFTDVYDEPTPLLREQEQEVRDMVERFPDDYPSSVPLKDS